MKELPAPVWTGGFVSSLRERIQVILTEKYALWAGLIETSREAQVRVTDSLNACDVVGDVILARQIRFLDATENRAAAFGAFFTAWGRPHLPGTVGSQQLVCTQ